MKYWWASQGNKFPVVMEQRILWSRPTDSGALPRSRVYLKKMRRGDIVFHYSGPFLRAVSRVSAEWETASRPPGHREKKFNEGWRVRVEPLKLDLEIPWQRVAELINHGSPGPFTFKGKPALKYASPLSEEEGLRLLQETGVSLPPDVANAESLLGRPATSWVGEETDEEALSTVRREQAHLRRHLLQGRTMAPCSICGEVLPARLLIAGHIKPRNLCTEEERADFAAAAMLICALGCDALFEWGYIVVDATGHVGPGRPAETKDLEAAMDRLVGKICTVHNASTATNFEAHRFLATHNS